MCVSICVCSHMGSPVPRPVTNKVIYLMGWMCISLVLGPGYEAECVYTNVWVWGGCVLYISTYSCVETLAVIFGAAKHLPRCGVSGHVQLELMRKTHIIISSSVILWGYKYPLPLMCIYSLTLILPVSFLKTSPDILHKLRILKA